MAALYVYREFDGVLAAVITTPPSDEEIPQDEYGDEPDGTVGQLALNQFHARWVDGHRYTTDPDRFPPAPEVLGEL